MTDGPPHRFMFEFAGHDADDDDLTVYWFAFLDQIARVEQMSIDSDDFQGRTEELEEEYGVHDFATSGDHELVGFHSYEVEPDRQEELVGKWRDFFIGQGVAVGEIMRMSRAEYERRF